jgi:MFS family permease
MDGPRTGRVPVRLPALLRETAFRRYWIGRTASQVGSQVTGVAFPLAAVLVLHASAAAMGVVMAAGSVPALLLSIPIGAWIDRFGRRRQVMVAADIARAILWGSIPAAYLAGRLTVAQLVAVALVGGVFGVMSRAANPAVFVALVARDDFLAAGAWIQGGRAVAWLIGPTIAGVLVQALSAPLAILADASAFVVSAVTLATIRREEPPATPRERGHTLAGLRFVLASPVLRPILYSSATTALFRAVLLALYMLYAVTRLHVTAWEIGIILGPGSAGALLGSALAHRITKRMGLGRSLIASALVYAAPTALVPLAGGSAAAVLVYLILAESLSGMGLMVHEVAQGAILAAAVPDAVRARVNGVVSTFSLGARPVGALAGGLVATAVGLHTTLWIAAAGATLGAAWLWHRRLAAVATVDQAASA